MNEPLLKPETYAVLSRVPNEWMHEETVKEEISRHTNQVAGSVSRRIAQLIRLQLVQRRPAADGPEVRRCAW